ncbi:MAG: DUF3575 domain-containing protein [Paramuribaculum sp.]|nr:DUF3575 domain-containing protein [Paramuribaculum sp.]
MRKLCYILLGLLIFAPLATFAHHKSVLLDSAKVVRFTYRIGQTSPDISNPNNRTNLKALIDRLNGIEKSHDSVAVDITYFCAPGGVNSINQGVGEARADRLIKTFVSETQLPDSVFFITDGEEGWKELYSIISHSQIDNAEEILGIITTGDPATRIKRLKRLNKGKTYSILKENVFPRLRARVNVTVGTPRDVAALLREREMFALGVASANGCDTCSPSCNCAQNGTLYQYARRAPVPDFLESGDFAIKTNVIYDFVLIPSIELEYRFHRQWSVGLEYDMGWWKKRKKDKSYQIAVVSPEVRWWFPTSTPLKGYYIGAFPGFTWYDFENGGTGHRGHGIFGGISFGLTHPISSQVAFEAGLGVGYLNLRYKDYEPVDDHNVYSREKVAGYFGPLKVKFAIVWHPWGGTSKKSKQAR